MLHWKMGIPIISRYPTISKIDISNPTVAYSTDESINGNSCLLKTLEPGECVITITDIYGQKLISTVSVTQKLDDPHTQTSYTATSETVDSALPVPTIKSIDYGDGWMEEKKKVKKEESKPKNDEKIIYIR